MDKQCEIVHDLLPLYVDGACSESSATMVKEHLETCPECKTLYEKLCSDTGEGTLKAEMVGVVAKREKKVKKKRLLTIAVSVFLTIVLIFTAISLWPASIENMLFTTAEFRTYQSYSEKHKAGMEKQKILDKLGCPDGYVDAQGNYHAIARVDQERFEENLAEDNSTAWVYECWKRPDPADPYRLKITFDADGKSKSAELTLVPGG